MKDNYSENEHNGGCNGFGDDNDDNAVINTDSETEDVNNPNDKVTSENKARHRNAESEEDKKKMQATKNEDCCH